jgi:8-oxo-dGTP diphosphatase
MDIYNDKNYLNHIAIECVIFGYEDHKLKILLSKLKFKGDFHDLYSGFIKQDEDVDEAAKRILEIRTGITDIYLEEFKVFGKADRKNKEFFDNLIKMNYVDKKEITALKMSDIYKWYTNRYISIGYYSLVNIKKVKPKLTPIDESIEWYDVNEVPALIMDHNEILVEALKSLKEDIDKKFNAFNLLPDTFTMNEIQDIYETIFDRTYTRSNFQKKILEMDVLERLEKKFTGAKNKAPYLYRMK